MLGLEFLLKQNNIQYKDFAEQLGVSKQIVSIWINGTRKISKHHIPKICEVLNTTEEFLVGTIDEKYINDTMIRILNKDYQYILATMFDVDKELIDNNLIDFIKLNIEKKKLEIKLNQINNKLENNSK